MPLFHPSLRPLAQEAAETVALHALGFLAADEALMGAFLAASGLALDDVRRSASDAHFLGGVLDFVLADEAISERFSTSEGLRPGELHAARAGLPGGDAPHWT